MLWTPWGKDPQTFWGCNCSCFAVDFILKKLSIFAWCFIVNGARPSDPAKYYHQSELSVLITSQLKIKLIPE